MAQVTEKSAISSKGIWGAVLAAVPFLLETGVQVLQGLPPSPHTSSAIAIIGSILMIYSKISPKQSRVTGLVAPKNAPKSSDGL